MPVSLVDIRNELLPGLSRNFYGRLNTAYKITKAAMDYDLYHGTVRVYPDVFVPKAPAIILPKVSVPIAVAAGIAAAIIRNPTVSRRFWQGWSR